MLERFIKAQEGIYDIALEEIKNGYKVTHWMWFIFPQIKGLGQSATSEYYAIKDIDEARAYLNNDILGKRLIEITKETLKLSTNNPYLIFGNVDALKFKSCMTLFNIVLPNNVFMEALNKFFDGQKDLKTINYVIKNR